MRWKLKFTTEKIEFAFVGPLQRNTIKIVSLSVQGYEVVSLEYGIVWVIMVKEMPCHRAKNVTEWFTDIT